MLMTFWLAAVVGFIRWLLIVFWKGLHLQRERLNQKVLNSLVSMSIRQRVESPLTKMSIFKHWSQSNSTNLQTSWGWAGPSSAKIEVVVETEGSLVELRWKFYLQWKFIIVTKTLYSYENSSFWWWWKFTAVMKIHHCYQILTSECKFITVMKIYYLDKNSLCRKHKYLNQNSLWWKSSQRWKFFTVMKNYLWV